MRKHLAWLLTALLALALLPLFGASATEIVVSPLTDERVSTYSYEYWLPDVQLGLMLPLTSYTEIYLDDPHVKCVAIENKNVDAVPTAFFAIDTDPALNRDVRSLDAAEMRKFLSVITQSPDDVTYEILEDFLPDIDAVRVKEAHDDVYSEHLLAVHGTWVLNAMLQSYDGSDAFAEEALAWQRQLLTSALDRSDRPERYTSYTFPGTDAALSVTGSLHLSLSSDEPDIKWVHITKEVLGVEPTVLHITAHRDAAYADQTAATLDADAVQAILDASIFSQLDEGSAALLPEDAYAAPVLTGTIRGKACSILLLDGWAFVITDISENANNEAWAAVATDAVLRQLLGEDIEIPQHTPAGAIVQEGDTVRIPMMWQDLVLRIPGSYVLDIVTDTAAEKRVALFEPDSGDYYLLIMQQVTDDPGATLPSRDETVDFLSSSADMVAEKYSRDGEGGEAQHTLQYDGPLALPALWFENEQQSVCGYFMMVDAYLTNLLFETENAPMDETIPGTFAEMMRLESK